jgi:hypothetical protein
MLSENTDDVEVKWQRFRTYMGDLVDRFVPQKEIDTRKKKKWKTPLDISHLKHIRKKHALWKKFIRTKSGESYQNYCRTRNKIRSITRKAQKEYEKKIAREAKKNPKAVWNFIKSKTKTKESIPELYTDPNNDKSTLETEDNKKAEVLGKYFKSVFTREPAGPVPEAHQRRIIEEMGKLNITTEIVSKTLADLKTNKSQGPDAIHPRILKELADELSIPLQIIYQDSIDQAKVPQDWKNATVTAIYKKGNRKVASNYRPISLTSIVCKSLEKIIRHHIITFMKVNKLFSPKQFGFINGRSTTLQLLRVLDEWTEALDCGYEVDVAYLDYQKAFDTVPHRRLIYKLETYHIHPTIVNWVED